ncbi:MULTISPECIES: hypothetical protein [Hymenobacter]|uniref:Uncharacterized protein n=1 Tax=Hymenobacter mucosus TaxID=1411120 RepID=A0A238YV07_9BACT|nr:MULTISPECIES: hypothetical protein [Hymenobacter]SNR74638.1 hypothetical protein SAMN06269173_10697 [Hymenobacter mucosus]
MKVLAFPLLLAAAIATAPPKPTRWMGTIQNGVEGAKVSFLLSPDGQRVSNFTFDGVWWCSGDLKRQIIGPQNTFEVREGKLHGVSPEPASEGATAWHFEVAGSIDKSSASGTFCMNSPTLGCDTNQLYWTAVPMP